VRWEPIKGPAEANALLAELRRELPAAHPLASLPLRAVGRRSDCDDVLFAVEDGSGRVMTVHLTWRGSQEVLPWPASSLYDDKSPGPSLKRPKAGAAADSPGEV
jgi:hypothetical protein